MKMMKSVYKIGFVVLLFVSMSHVADAQYMNPYGGYGGGYGSGYGRGYNQFGAADFDRKPKGPLDPDEVAKEETKAMVKKLKLDEEQELIIGSLNEDYAYQKKAMFERFKKEFEISKPTPAQIEEAKSKMNALEEKKDAELEKILNENQFKTYKAWKAKMQKNNQ